MKCKSKIRCDLKCIWKVLFRWIGWMYVGWRTTYLEVGVEYKWKGLETKTIKPRALFKGNKKGPKKNAQDEVYNISRDRCRV